MSQVSRESSWLALRDAVGTVMSALAPTTANSKEGPSREKRCKE
jgi:hypothetical protein